MENTILDANASIFPLFSQNFGLPYKSKMQHSYRDHSKEESPNNNNILSFKFRRTSQRGGVAIPFPEKLFTMLSEAEERGFDHIVSWQPHGRCFIVHKPSLFVETIMPQYFRQTKMTSFQRQLNLYDFNRFSRGRDRSGYYHELFLRGKPDLCKRIMRVRVKGGGPKANIDPNLEPDFYKMAFVNAGAGESNAQPIVFPGLVTSSINGKSEGAGPSAQSPLLSTLAGSMDGVMVTNAPSNPGAFLSSLLSLPVPAMATGRLEATDLYSDINFNETLHAPKNLADFSASATEDDEELKKTIENMDFDSPTRASCDDDDLILAQTVKNLITAPVMTSGMQDELSDGALHGV